MKKVILGLIIAGIFSMSNLANAATIDLMTISFSYPYNPGGYFFLFGGADQYFLSDGTSWTSGAGSITPGTGDLQSVEISDNIIKYTFTPPIDRIIYNQTDYNNGDHSSQGELAAIGPLVLEAEIGSTTATMSGYAKIISNDETWYGEPLFNYFSADVGTIVEFSISYTLQDATWTENLFDNSFTYSLSGYVDFTSLLQIKNDFNGDGTADVLLRNSATGAWHMYLMGADATPIPYPNLPMYNQSFIELAGIADFDGDDKADVLLHNNENGNWHLFLMDGPDITPYYRIALNTSLGLDLVEIADFNSDGKADVLLRNITNGSWSMSLMDGPDVTSYNGIDLPTDLNLK